MLMPSIFGENLFDGFFDDFFHPSKRGMRFAAPSASVMRTDIRETDAGFELTVDLPGYKKENVKAGLRDGYLTIQAEQKEQKDEKKDEKGKYVRRERYYGSCSRSFYVGEDVSEEDVKAKFEDGILKVFVPKKDPQPAVEENRYIPIED